MGTIIINGIQYYIPESYQLIMQYSSLKSVYNWMKQNPDRVEKILGKKMIKA